MDYIVTGCGVSVLCHSQKAVLEWMDFMLEKGGAPQVKEVTGPKQLAEAGFL